MDNKKTVIPQNDNIDTHNNGKILVVGGTGYLGKKLLESLILHQYEVTCTFLPEENYSSTASISPLIHFIPIDIISIKDILEKDKYDWIVNLAAKYEKGNTNIASIVNVNTLLAVQLLTVACECGVKNFMTIDTSLPENFNLYSFSKKRVAEFGKYFAGKRIINFNNICLEMFYGPGEPKNRFLPNTIHKLRENQTLDLTEGKQLRDIIHIYDVIEILLIILHKQLSGYHDFPIGTGEAASIREIVLYLKKILNSKSELRFGAVPSRLNEPNCVADINKLFDCIGEYKIKYPWKEGLKNITERESD